jgi:hypothetical protein
MTIHAPKTEHHENGGIRVVPIFPELMPYLLPMLEGTGPEDYLLPHLRLLSNPYTQFKRFVKKAGLVPWPKLWQNLRSTRETELMENKDFSLQAVCQWIGNSPVVALKHYAQVREHEFHIATGSEDEKALQKAMQNKAGTLQSAAHLANKKSRPIWTTLLFRYSASFYRVLHLNTL